MIKINFIAIIFLFISCSHNKQVRFLTKRTTVSNQTEAKFILENQKQYLEMIFQQSKDPYYGKLRWTQECIDENKIGKIETEKYLQLISVVYLNQYLSPGFCSNQTGSAKYVDLVIFCSSQKEVREYKIPYKNFSNNPSDYCL